MFGNFVLQLFKYNMYNQSHIPEKRKKNPIITIEGYFINYDQWNRAKLMFLDDYDGDLTKMSFAKSYMIMKDKSMDGKCPLIDNKTCMLVNCPKNALGHLPNNAENIKKIKVIPIQKLVQHKVCCVVSVNQYKFKKGFQTIQGWNLKLLKMTMLEL
jgi:hypothetical protein